MMLLFLNAIHGFADNPRGQLHLHYLEARPGMRYLMPSGSWDYLPLGSGCALKESRVSCLLITFSSSSAPASLSRSISGISGRICSWVSSRSCSGVWAGTERVVAERRRLVMISPPCVLRLDNVASATRFLFFWGRNRTLEG